MSCLAIRLCHLPDWQFVWYEVQPQHSRESLSISDFLPSEEDAAELEKRGSTLPHVFPDRGVGGIIRLNKIRS